MVEDEGEATQSGHLTKSFSQKKEPSGRSPPVAFRFAFRSSQNKDIQIGSQANSVREAQTNSAEMTSKDHSGDDPQSNGSPSSELQMPEGLESLFVSETLPDDLEALMASNHDLLDTLYGGPRKSLLSRSCSVPPLPLEFMHLLWFALPLDAARSLLDSEPRPRLAHESLPLLPSQSVRTLASVNEIASV